MDGDRTERALARIEAALHRLEGAARRPVVASGGDPALEARHAHLRQTVNQTLEQLDALIGGGAT